MSDIKIEVGQVWKDSEGVMIVTRIKDDLIFTGAGSYFKHQFIDNGFTLYRNADGSLADESKPEQDNSFADARRFMCETFEADMAVGGTYHSYVANIAMFLHDRCGVTDHTERNCRANELMGILFGVGESKPEQETISTDRKVSTSEELIEHKPDAGLQVADLRKNGTRDGAECNHIYFDGLSAWFLPEGPTLIEDASSQHLLPPVPVEVVE